MGENKSKLRTIYPKNRENFKNSSLGSNITCPYKKKNVGEISKSDLTYIICGTPQRSIFGPLLILVYVNDLSNTSPLLDPIMFADNANLFFNYKDI